MEGVTRNASKPGWTPAPEISSVVRMPSHLLTTKFHAPVWRPASVSRPRLVAQLQAGLAEGRKLTLISAPAGYGKTTLAAEWLHALAGEPPVAWLALDARDDDPARFLSYCLAALQRIHPNLGQGIQSLLDLPQLALAPALLDALINDLAGLDAPLALALDDYHVIGQLAIHEALNYLVEHQPPNLHLFLLSRTDPPLHLARLRVRGQMTELRSHDLRFTAGEARQFFGLTPRLSLADETLRALNERTEGWVAGLQLAALALQHQPDPVTFIETFRGSHRYVLDYLADEVIRQQGEALRSFLIQTSVLERFTADACCALTGQPDAQAVIAQLEQANLFIVPLDDERVWYRYHHLFSDYLRTLLTKEQQTELCKKASVWHETREHMAEAVHYALASGDPEFAADVIERALNNKATWSGGNLAQWLSWLDALPAQAYQSRPQLSLDASRILYLGGRLDLAEQRIAQTEQTLKSLPATPEIEQMLALAALYRGAIAAVRGDSQQAIEQIAFARSRIPPENHLAHARAFFSLGLAREIADQTELAVENYLQSSAEAQSASVIFLAVHALCAAAQVQIKQGRLRLAERTCHAALQLAHGTRIAPLGLARVILGAIALERNDLAAAERLLGDGIVLARQGGLMDDVALGLALFVRLRVGQGDTDGALAVVQEVKSITQVYGIQRTDVLASAYLARLQLRMGQKSAAAQWAVEVRPLLAAVPHEFVEMTLARILLATDELEALPAILHSLLERATAAGRMQSCIEALLLLALCHHAKGDTAAALDRLGKSLRLAAAEGYTRIFLDEGKALLDLLPWARHCAPELVDSLLSMSSPGSGATPAPLGQSREPLSAQEVRVLRLIAAGKSNQEIAGELVISLGTAKWHVHNLLQKLGVTSRGQAMVQARELGLH